MRGSYGISDVRITRRVVVDKKKGKGSFTVKKPAETLKKHHEHNYVRFIVHVTW